MQKFKLSIIELSQNCNLDCIMCGFGKRHNSPDKFMSYNQFLKIYDDFKNNTETIRLNGRGESTIHPDFKKIINHIGYNNRMSLFTNGNYTNDEINQLFIKYDIELYFSMDSPNKVLLEQIRRGVHFDRINYNISQMNLKKTRPFIIFTIQEMNINEIIPIAEYAIEHNCHLIYNVVRRDEGIELFRKIIDKNKHKIINEFNHVEHLFYNLDINVFIPDQISGIRIKPDKRSTTCGSMDSCKKIDEEICILYNGDVTPCNMFNPFVYGNIKVQSIEDILSGEKKKWFIENHKSYYYCENCACLVG